MVKYLECPDLHRSPGWAETSAMIEKRIIEVAESEGVDFVTLPGDYWDAATYASDKGGINEAISFIEQLSRICPVVAIEGTKSHDAPGSYGPLVKAGLVLLKPGKMYGYSESGIRELNPSAGWDGTPECLLFGIPEPSKDWVQATEANTSAEAVNARVIELVGELIIREIAPRRAMLPTVPAIGLFHGNVSDASSREAETDVILKASDIVIKTEILAAAGLDRWTLGHIHTPWESRKISAGYSGFAGIDRNPWGKCGFIPAMDMVSVGAGLTPMITRVHYGTPMRVKLTAPLDAYDPTVAYWLETDDPAATLPAAVHPWSRVTHNEVKTTSRRVESEGITKAQTLTDMARLFNPAITPLVERCFNEIEKTVKRPVLEARSVTVCHVRITGATFWSGKTIELDINALQSGLTQLSGANGSGKSSLIGFCTPFPGMVGKDTDSGRQSAIKDFFTESESAIEKTIRFNGEEHKHLITIKAAHTKNPKTECYFTVNGLPVLEKSTFDEMMSECVRRYGSLEDYCSTTFYIQPLQGKAESGLMTASMTTVRDLVQNIAGIDYTKEKEHALARMNELKAETSKTEIEINASEKMIPDADVIRANIAEAEALKPYLATRLTAAEFTLYRMKTNLTAATVEKERIDVQLRRKAELLAESSRISTEVAVHKAKADNLRAVISSAPMVRTAIDGDAVVKAAYETARTASVAVEARNSAARLENQRVESRNREIEAEIARIKAETERRNEKSENEWREAVAKRGAEMSENAAIEREITLLNKPCEHCGKNSSTAAARIAILEMSRHIIGEIPAAPVLLNAEASPDLFAELSSLATHVPAPIETVTLPSAGLSADELFRYRALLDSAARSEAELSVIETEMIPSKTANANRLAMESAAINAHPVDITDAQSCVDTAQVSLDGIKSEIANLNAQISAMNDTLAGIETMRTAITSRRAALAGSLELLEAWKKTDTMLSPSKIPAFELDTFLDSIDAEATRRVEPYKQGRYMFQTVTQKEGADKFDIMVLDKETGNKRSFLKYSVGQKSFLNDAYCKALTRVRKSRMKTEYSPIILDESDSFVEIQMIPVFYEIQKAYYTTEKVLVVSHSPDAGNFIQNKVEMEDLIK